MSTAIYHLEYRIGKEPKEHIYATKKICEKKKKTLLELHGSKIKFGRIIRA
tara:strand:- start:10139 stop:10291 length:153 start_codon:yes stop_codon:yes gene_type:complete